MKVFHIEKLSQFLLFLTTLLSSWKFHLEEGVPLLGGTVSRSAAFSSAIARKRANQVVDLLTTLLKLKDPQLCLTLMRVCVGMCKMIYCFRTTHPSFLTEASEVLTSALKQALSKIVVGTGPFFGDFQFHLASLPVRFSGIGITIPSDMLPLAHLASTLDTWNLQSVIFPSISTEKSIYLFPLVNHFLQSINKTDTQISDFLNTLPLLNTHHFLADMYFKKKRELLLGHSYLASPLCTPYASQHKLILQSNSSQPFISDKTKRPNFSCTLASQWLFAMPNSRLGQTMPPVEYRAALCFRLLIPFRSHSINCPHDKCSALLDPFGYHALSCGGVGSLRTARHEIMVRALTDLAQVSGFCPAMNTQVQCLGESTTGSHYYRPADILINGDNHQRICVDITIVSPLSDSKSTLRDGKDVGFLVTKAAENKILKHSDACSSADLGFIPFALDVCGVIDLAALYLLSTFASAYSKNLSKSYVYALHICRRRISFALQTGISRQLSSVGLIPPSRSRPFCPTPSDSSRSLLPEKREILLPNLGDYD